MDPFYLIPMVIGYSYHYRLSITCGKLVVYMQVYLWKWIHAVVMQDLPLIEPLFFCQRILALTRIKFQLFL